MNSSIDSTFEELLAFGNSITDLHERAAFTRKLQADIKKIKSTLACMKLTGATPERMWQETSRQIDLLRDSKERFLANRVSFIQTKVSAAPGPTFTPLSISIEKQKTARELMREDDFWLKEVAQARAQDPLYDFKEGRIQESMAAARVVAAGINGVAAVVNTLVVQPLVYVACHRSPGAERLCEKSKEDLKKAAEATGVSNFVKSLQKAHLRLRDETMPRAISTQFPTIPREAVQQSVSDAVTIATAAVPIPPLFKIGKRIYSKPAPKLLPTAINDNPLMLTKLSGNSLKIPAAINDNKWTLFKPQHFENYKSLMIREMNLRQESFLPKVTLPSEFPQHFFHFLTQASVKKFSWSSRTGEKRETLKANIYYVSTKNREEVLYVVKHSSKSITSIYLDSFKRLDIIIDHLIKDAREEGYKKVFIAAGKMPLMSVMLAKPEKMIAQGTFSKGKLTEPLCLIEIDIR